MSSLAIEARLSIEALHFHRALTSLQEELEAIDYYHQRADRTEDPELRAVLLHNRDDEMEHAVMLLEWLRRTLPALDGQLRRLLFGTGSIAGRAGAAAAGGHSGRGLGLGNLK